MSLESNPDARVYYVPARRRLEDAKILLDNNRRDGAGYMAGFAVECLLKALILSNSTPRERPRLLARLKGEFGHDLDTLRTEAARRGIHLGRPGQDAFRRIATWDNNDRYEARIQSREVAEAAYAAAEYLFDWADRVGGH
jgi:HEPN domain-containing protein